MVAVQKSGLALEYAGPELRADREIVLAAVQKSGSALGHTVPELRDDREIVLAAVQEAETRQDESWVWRHAGRSIKAEMQKLAARVGVEVMEYVHALLHPFVVTVQSVKRLSDTSARVHVSTIGGATATVDVDGGAEVTTFALRVPLAVAWGVSVAAFSFVMQSGQVGNVGSEARLQ